MRLPTGSALDLAMGPCLHSFTSGIYWPREEDDGRFAYNNACHDVGEAAVGGAVDVGAIARARSLTVPETRRLALTASHIVDHVAGLVADGWALTAELAVAYNCETGRARVMRRATHRDYSDRREGEMTATLDLVAVRPGEVRVDDWKSGMWKTREQTSWQLRFGGLAVARLVGAEEVDVALLYVDENGLRPEPSHLDAFDLATTAAGMRSLWRRLHAGPTPPVKGAHCTAHYCKLLGLCSETAGALVKVRETAIDTASDAARVWALIPHAEAAVKAAKARIRELAARQPIDLGGGRRLAVVEQSRETVDLSVPGAPEALRAAMGGAADAAIDVSTSKAAIERAAGGKKAARPTLDALRAIGAFRTSTFGSVKEVAATETTEATEEGEQR